MNGKVIIWNDEMTAIITLGYIPVDNQGSAVSKTEQGGLFWLWLRTNQFECPINYRGITQAHLVCNQD